jgi:uncharacterized protein (DUF2252 family)
VALTDPKKLARRQLQLDRERTVGGHVGKPLGRILYARKIARMRVSPFAFLRGAAPMFYELLESRPELAAGPPGKGWLAGDLHLENFGAYHPEHVHASPEHKRGTKKASEHRARVVFGLNDFDDAVRGPFRLDVLRLLTSIVLAGRELGCDGVTSIKLCRAFLDGYRRDLEAGQTRPTKESAAKKSSAKKNRSTPTSIPGPVLTLIEQVATRTRTELLAGRTELHHGGRRFVRGERYVDLPAKMLAEVPKALARYAAGLTKDERVAPEELEVIDAALRIAGTGSLGSLRIAALVRGKGGPNGGFVFDLKEQGEPSASVLLGRSPLSPAERVLAAFRATASPPPRLLGTSRIGRVPLFVRRLMPQEDKLDLAHIAAADLEPLAAYLGLLVGEAHGRGASVDGEGRGGRKPVRWSVADGEAMVDRALTVAGIHESVYLAYCKLVLDEMNEG